jgi:hypothetical protein
MTGLLQRRRLAGGPFDWPQADMLCGIGAAPLN